MINFLLKLFTNRKLVTVYTIRVIYKSGYFHDFDVLNFSFKEENGTIEYTWTAFDEKNKPFRLGVDDIQAVWKIDQYETYSAPAES